MHRFLAACSLMFLLPFSVRASGPAFISEVAWAGSSASLADEWMEICAAPGTDLSGWSIEGVSSVPIVLPEGSLVTATGAFLVSNYAADDAKSTLASASDLVTTALALSNSTLAVSLRDASGNPVDAAGDGGAPPAGTSGETKASMGRADATSPWTTASTSSGFDEGAPESGTPGTCSIGVAAEAPVEEAPPVDAATTTDEVATEEPSAAGPPIEPLSPVRVSEIYPSPLSGEKEWIELLNPSAVGEFLDGWALEDAAGTKTPLAGLLLPWGRVIVESPKGSLNNDGDTIVLRDRFGRELDRETYGRTVKGHSIMRVELQETFVATLTPTPGTANVFTETELAQRDEEKPVTSSSTPIVTPTPIPLSSRPERSAAEGSIQPAIDPSAALGMTKVAKAVAEYTSKKPAAKPKTAASKYKGDAYVATVVVPPGVYSKTRAYVHRGEAIEELRFSKSAAGAWNVGDHISFVAQAKTEGAVAFLLANPNSVRTIGSASATFATAEAWPEEAGGYRFTAEVVAIRGNALEVKLGGVEGDLLMPSDISATLKPGDTVQVEGFIASGPRPKVVLPYAGALRLFMAHLPDDAPARTAKLPASVAVGLTFVAGATGLIAYLRMQRLKRLALLSAPIEGSAWE